MKFSVTTFAVVVAFIAGSSASPTLFARQMPSAAQINQAIQAWQADTATVSAFLDAAANLGNFASNADFESQALTATNAEKDELTHKAVLDMEFPGQSNAQIVQANQVLVADNTFQNVVDQLQEMSVLGESRASADVTNINNDRCVHVLPCIDVYFAQGAIAAGDSGAPLTAARPAACTAICQQQDCSCNEPVTKMF
ncbi:hypothetical protein NA57DRAFT_55051 [Rhizodiscina lignyota]|uniref:Uncharacterized protein n=1 Tax=Rhizodiscina lignyota TaxID=1504668 RepID=A0A9P4IMR8_9PEZI|nr:hypothetical protein NA57DRAFT_55051 [Rhizodiscina lignyota]